MTDQKKILVLGGSGFIGSAICKNAVEAGHEVVSISRSGKPGTDADWTERVSWITANALQPDTWRDHLQGCHAVIHCVGILREKPTEGQTYQRINMDSVETTAWEAEQAGVERFVFLSVGEASFLPDRFTDTKRLGENALHHIQVRHLVLRPTFVYGPGRFFTRILGGLLEAADKLPGVSLFDEKNRPLDVEQVADVAVQAATDLDYEGVISANNIAALAHTPQTNGHTSSQRNWRPWLLGGAAAGVALLGMAWGARRL